MQVAVGFNFTVIDVSKGLNHLPLVEGGTTYSIRYSLDVVLAPFSMGLVNGLKYFPSKPLSLISRMGV